jgi:hypothetical protein
MAATSETKHARLSASGMYRWAACPGSVRLSASAPPGAPSRYAAEGTAAHEVAAFCLATKKNAAALLGRVIAGFTVDEEMAEAVQVYLDAVRAAQGSAEPGVLIVFDYKHGRGVPVEVYKNLQLVYYAFGALYTVPKVPKTKPRLFLEHRFDLEKLRPDFGGTCDAIYHPGGALHTIRLVVVQPRCGHADGPVRAWQMPLTELLDFHGDLLAAARRADDPNAPLVPGDHCKFCPAAAICPALEQRSHALTTMDFSDLTAPTYEPAKLAAALAMIPELETRIEAVRKLAYAELTAGRSVPGWKLVQKRATRKWRDEDGAAAVLRDIEGIYTEPKLKSPAQIETLLGGKKRASLLIGDHVIAESSGTALAPESDPRPAVVGLLEFFESETGEKSE